MIESVEYRFFHCHSVPDTESIYSCRKTNSAFLNLTIDSHNSSLCNHPNVIRKNSVNLFCGYYTINSAFAKQGLIDEVILNIEPIIIGKGIPLFNPQDFDLKLKLISVGKVHKEIVQFRYECIKSN